MGVTESKSKEGRGQPPIPAAEEGSRSRSPSPRRSSLTRVHSIDDEEYDAALSTYMVRALAGEKDGRSTPGSVISRANDADFNYMFFWSSTSSEEAERSSVPSDYWKTHQPYLIRRGSTTLQPNGQTLPPGLSEAPSELEEVRRVRLYLDGKQEQQGSGSSYFPSSPSFLAFLTSGSPREETPVDQIPPPSPHTSKISPPKDTISRSHSSSNNTNSSGKSRSRGSSGSGIASGIASGSGSGIASDSGSGSGSVQTKYSLATEMDVEQPAQRGHPPVSTNAPFPYALKPPTTPRPPTPRALSTPPTASGQPSPSPSSSASSSPSCAGCQGMGVQLAILWAAKKAGDEREAALRQQVEYLNSAKASYEAR